MVFLSAFRFCGCCDRLAVLARGFMRARFRGPLFLCRALHNAWALKDFETLATLRDELLPLHEAMFVETNPCPVKYAAALLGFGDGSVRLPLWEISELSKQKVRDAMSSLGIL